MPVIGTNATLITEDIAAKMAEHKIPRISRLGRLPDRRGARRVPRPAGLLRRHDRGHQDGQAPRRRRADQHDRHHAQRRQDRGDPRPRRVARRRRVPHLHARARRAAAPTCSTRSCRPRSTSACWRGPTSARRPSPLHFKPTDAPHYYRIIRQLAKAEGKKVTREEYGLDAMTRGCLGGITFCFISHIGDIQPCGYFDMQLGNVKEQPFSRDLDRVARSSTTCATTRCSRASAARASTRPCAAVAARGRSRSPATTSRPSRTASTSRRRGRASATSTPLRQPRACRR